MPIKVGAFNIIQIDKGETPNPCGECRACCSTLEVVDGDFNKPANTPCKYLCEAGCSIYTSKPSLCSTYYCMYAVLDGLLDGRDRPDKVGILVSMSDEQSHFSKTTGIPLFAAYEIKPDAFLSYNGDKLLRKFERKVVLALIEHSKLSSTEGMIDATTKFIGPDKYLHLVTSYRSLHQRAFKKSR